MKNNAEIKKGRIYLSVGFIAGFLISFILSLIFLRLNGSFEYSNNPFTGPPPMMVALIFGFLGAIIGSISTFVWKFWGSDKS